MPNMNIKYAIEKHASAFPSNILAGIGGQHMFSVELTSDTDNGNLIGLGDYISLDLYREAAATTFEGKIVAQMTNGNYLVQVINPGDAVFVYNIPIGAETYSKEWLDEKNLYNKKGDRARCYGLVKYDTFELSVEGFDGVPAVGKAITGVTAKKLVVGA